MIDLREVRSVTEFQRNIKDYVGRLKQRRTPLVLTVNGRAELVVQDAGKLSGDAGPLGTRRNTRGQSARAWSSSTVVKVLHWTKLKRSFGRSMAFSR